MADDETRLHINYIYDDKYKCNSQLLLLFSVDLSTLTIIVGSSRSIRMQLLYELHTFHVHPVVILIREHFGAKSSMTIVCDLFYFLLC